MSLILNESDAGMHQDKRALWQNSASTLTWDYEICSIIIILIIILNVDIFQIYDNIKSSKEVILNFIMNLKKISVQWNHLCI